MARLLFGTFAAHWSAREQVEVGGSEKKDKATCVTVSLEKSRCAQLYMCAKQGFEEAEGRVMAKMRKRKKNVERGSCDD